MESYYELSYMETSVQIYNLREEIKILQREKDCIEQKIALKMKQDAELSAKNLRWMRIIKQKMGSEGPEKYSPKKRGIFPPTPKKKASPVSSSPSQSSSSVQNVSGSKYPSASCSPKKISGTCNSKATTSSVVSTSTNSSGSELVSATNTKGPNSNEITLGEAKSILNKYKTDKNDDFEMEDGVTDDDLLTVNEALELIGKPDAIVVNSDNVKGKDDIQKPNTDNKMSPDAPTSGNSKGVASGIIHAENNIELDPQKGDDNMKCSDDYTSNNGYDEVKDNKQGKGSRGRKCKKIKVGESTENGQVILPVPEHNDNIKDESNSSQGKSNNKMAVGEKTKNDDQVMLPADEGEHEKSE